MAYNKIRKIKFLNLQTLIGFSLVGGDKFSHNFWINIKRHNYLCGGEWFFKTIPLCPISCAWQLVRGGSLINNLSISYPAFRTQHCAPFKEVPLFHSSNKILPETQIYTFATVSNKYWRVETTSFTRVHSLTSVIWNRRSLNNFYRRFYGSLRAQKSVFKDAKCGFIFC